MNTLVQTTCRPRFRSAMALTRAASTLTPHDQIFKLRDGRDLAYIEYGDPHGYPVFYFHGYPSSRIEGDIAHKMAQRCGARLISFDRPGHGLSSPQPRRTFLDWPADMRDFASGQGIDRFAVFGLSGGGPYALACARALPRRMLTAVGLFASGPHWSSGVERMTRPRRVARVLAMHAPWVLHALLAGCTGLFRWVMRFGPIYRMLDRKLELADEMEAKEGKKEEQTRTVPERREFIVRALVGEPFRQGAAAAVRETQLLVALDWGFELEDVDYDKVLIWHGTEDINAPIGMMRDMARRLPHADLRELKGESHYTVGPYIEGALAELVTSAKAR